MKCTISSPVRVAAGIAGSVIVAGCATLGGGDPVSYEPLNPPAHAFHAGLAPPPLNCPTARSFERWRKLGTPETLTVHVHTDADGGLLELPSVSGGDGRWSVLERAAVCIAVRSAPYPAQGTEQQLEGEIGFDPAADTPNTWAGMLPGNAQPSGSTGGVAP